MNAYLEYVIAISAAIVAILSNFDKIKALCYSVKHQIKYPIFLMDFDLYETMGLSIDLPVTASYKQAIISAQYHPVLLVTRKMLIMPAVTYMLTDSAQATGRFLGVRSLLFAKILEQYRKEVGDVVKR